MGLMNEKEVQEKGNGGWWRRGLRGVRGRGRARRVKERDGRRRRESNGWTRGKLEGGNGEEGRGAGRRETRENGSFTENESRTSAL